MTGYQVHPDTGISSKDMGIMNSFVNNIYDRIATEAARFAHYKINHRLPRVPNHNQVACIVPGELAKHPVSRKESRLLPSTPALWISR